MEYLSKLAIPFKATGQYLKIIQEKPAKYIDCDGEGDLLLTNNNKFCSLCDTLLGTDVIWEKIPVFSRDCIDYAYGKQSWIQS